MADIIGTKQDEDLGPQATTEADTIRAGGGNDTASGSDGDDDIWGGTGEDSLKGDAGEDDIDGGRGDDRLFGGADDDEVSGGRGNDHLWGNDGDDVMDGGRGDDILSGGAGDDEMSGGKGGDVFGLFNQDGGHDLILDFKAAEGDRLDLVDAGITTFDQLGDGDLTNGELTSDAEGNAVIDYGNDSSITLDGVQVADVTADYFNFQDDPGYNRGDFVQG